MCSFSFDCFGHLHFIHKQQKVQYARTKSDIVAKADGTFVPRPKKDKKRKAEERMSHFFNIFTSTSTH
jgi:hypothetical protein